MMTSLEYRNLCFVSIVLQVHTQNSNLNQSVTTVRTTQLGIVPTYSDPPKLSSTTEFSNAFPNENPPSASFIDTPEEGKLVRVGNMLQIVPERQDQKDISTYPLRLIVSDQISLDFEILLFNIIVIKRAKFQYLAPLWCCRIRMICR